MALSVLLIEDDRAAAESIALMLRAEGHGCDIAGLAAAGLEAVRRHAYDAILLDLMLPDMDGYEVLRRLRAEQVATPVLILSGLAELDSKVTGLGSGADDYLIKPVERRELIARLHAVVRRSMGHVAGAASPGAERGGLLARKGGAAPWSFDMSYRPAEDMPEGAATDPRAAGRNHGLALRRPSREERRPETDRSPPRRPEGGGHVVVIGNEKGGSGKSTTAIHIIASLAATGARVACLDLDLRQSTLTRFLHNRRTMAARRSPAMAMPEPTVADLAESDLARLHETMAQLVEAADYVVVDTPGSFTALSRAAHGWADTLVTPVNDSFLDLDVLGRLDPESLAWQQAGPYGATVRAAQHERARDGGTPIDWIVLRNRGAARETRNGQRLSAALERLSPPLGFRHAAGMTDRLIYRELFLAGLTLIDVGAARGQRMSMSHVAARQELRSLMEALGLPPRRQSDASEPAALLSRSA